MSVLALLAAAAVAAPVWVTSEDARGLMISWKAPQAAQVQVFITSGADTKTYALNEVVGTMIIASPSLPYRIGYRIDEAPPVILSESSRTRSRTEPSAEASGDERSAGPTAQVGIHFNSGFERADLIAPRAPEHLKSALRRATRAVELFIKVDASGKVIGTSSPYYRDAIRRDLARLASETAMKKWRFQQRTRANSRDARLQLSFNGRGTKIQAYRL